MEELTRAVTQWCPHTAPVQGDGEAPPSRCWMPLVAWAHDPSPDKMCGPKIPLHQSQGWVGEHAFVDDEFLAPHLPQLCPNTENDCIVTKLSQALPAAARTIHACGATALECELLGWHCRKRAHALVFVTPTGTQWLHASQSSIQSVKEHPTPFSDTPFSA